jgi:hypothetical protein
VAQICLRACCCTCTWAALLRMAHVLCGCHYGMLAYLHCTLHAKCCQVSHCTHVYSPGQVEISRQRQLELSYCWACAVCTVAACVCVPGDVPIWRSNRMHICFIYSACCAVGEARLPMPKGMAYKDLLLLFLACCADVQIDTACRVVRMLWHCCCVWTRSLLDDSLQQL